MNQIISILLPCYRYDRWLEMALKSISQNTTKFEIQTVVVCNNLSILDISKVKHLCSDLLPKNTLIVNAGDTDLVGALNYGLNFCSGDLVARMDQDDLMLPNRLELQAEYLDQHPEVALVGGSVNLISSSGKYIRTQSYPTTHDEILEKLHFGNTFAHPAVMFRKSCVLNIGGYDKIFTQAEDYALYLELSKRYKLANLEEVVLKYRISDVQISNVARSQQIISTKSLIVRFAGLEGRLCLPDWFPLENSQLANWYESTQDLNINVAKHTCDLVSHRLSRKVFASASLSVVRSSTYKNIFCDGKVRNELLFALRVAPIFTITITIKQIFKSLRKKRLLE